MAVLAIAGGAVAWHRGNCGRYGALGLALSAAFGTGPPGSDESGKGGKGASSRGLLTGDGTYRRLTGARGDRGDASGIGRGTGDALAALRASDGYGSMRMEGTGRRGMGLGMGGAILNTRRSTGEGGTALHGGAGGGISTGGSKRGRDAGVPPRRKVARSAVVTAFGSLGRGASQSPS